MLLGTASSNLAAPGARKRFHHFVYGRTNGLFAAMLFSLSLLLFAVSPLAAVHARSRRRARFNGLMFERLSAVGAPKPFFATAGD